jgi:hypothetical protein
MPLADKEKLNNKMKADLWALSSVKIVVGMVWYVAARSEAWHPLV